MNKIDKFRGDYDFLSNFYSCPVSYEGRIYPSSEAAFQAAKTLNLSERRKFEKMKPAEAKESGRRVKLRPDWESIKIEVMRTVVHNKFRLNLDLAQKLIDTGDSILVEGNWWNDRFWGVSGGLGQNWLGKILMEIREELQIPAIDSA